MLEGSTQIQKQLSPDEISELISTIKATGIMDKNCSGQIVLDYSPTYKLNIENREKAIDYPGCEPELLEIEKLIPTE